MTRRVVRAESRVVVDEATAERHDRALAVVQRLLIERGIRAHRHHTMSLGFFAARPGAPVWPGRAGLRSRTDRRPPELAVIAQGRRAATVTIGPRSGCYLVSVRDGPTLHAVRREQPHRVVELIVTDRLGEPS